MKPDDQDSPLDTLICNALQEGLAPIEPPKALRHRILQKIRQSTDNGLTTIHAEAPENWQPLAPGIEFKILTYNPEQTSKSFFLRAQPGTLMPAHDHCSYEECLVIKGEFCFGDLTLRAGDFHSADSSVSHVEAHTETGVLVYLHVNIHDYPGVIP